eukprot:4367960-Amphidinium_carterae.1
MSEASWTQMAPLELSWVGISWHSSAAHAMDSNGTHCAQVGMAYLGEPTCQHMSCHTKHACSRPVPSFPSRSSVPSPCELHTPALPRK